MPANPVLVVEVCTHAVLYGTKPDLVGLRGLALIKRCFECRYTLWVERMAFVTISVGFLRTPYSTLGLTLRDWRIHVNATINRYSTARSTYSHMIRGIPFVKAAISDTIIAIAL
jgi:hypothetical protein